MKKSVFSLVLSLLILAFIGGCGVNKKGKLRTGSRMFENTTARYNALYNANNLLSEYELGKQTNIADDYDQFLPVYYTIPQDSSNKALAEKVEKKMAAIVTKHESSKWTDDSYLDLGVAQYYSGKFDDAENTFKYIIQQFDPVSLQLQTYYPDEYSKRAEKARAEEKRKADKEAREEAVKLRKEEKKQREKEREQKKKERKQKVEKKEPTPEKNKATEKEIKTINEKRAQNDEPAPVRKGKMTEKERQEAIKARKQAIKDREKEKRRKDKNSEPQYADNKNIQEQEKKEASTVDKIDEVIASQEIVENEALEALGEGQDTSHSKNNFEANYYFQRPNALSKNGQIVEAYEIDSKKTDLHIPAFYEAILWLARTKTIHKEYYSSDIYLRQLFTLRNVPDYVIDDAYLAVADNYMQRGNYTATVVAIDEALKSGTIDNFEKARLSYLQGQIYEFLKEPLKAKESYDKVSSFHPDYEHLIRSDLNVLRIDAVQSGDAEDALKSLSKMSKEDKNKAYRDMIYFYMAQANYYYKNKEEAEELYLKSLSYKANNTTEIRIAYQNLSDIYLERPNYIKSYHYADSASVSPNPEETYIERAKQLERIATNLENIHLQDSLIKLALLSDEEKVKFAKKIMKQRRDDEILSKVKAERADNIQPASIGSSRSSANRGSSFFAYDAKSVKTGMKKFQKEYGNRPLVDNWKYASLMSGNQLFAELQSDEENNAGLTQGLFDQIFEDVPSTEEELQAAYEDREASKLEVGAGFYEDYPQYDKSKVYLDSVIISEKSTDELKLEAYNYLMLIAEKQGQDAEKNRIISIIQSKYPDFQIDSTEVVQEEVLDSLISKNKFFEDKYRESFAAYEDGKYQLLYDLTIEMIDTLDNTNALMPKFKLLNAFAIGGLGDRSSYATSLQKLSHEYHDTEEGKEAKEILKVLDLEGAEIEGEKDGEFESNVEFARHYVIIVINNDEEIFDIRNRLEEFNTTKFPNKKITLSLTRLQNVPVAEDASDQEKSENKSTTILVRSFDDKRQGLDYMDKLTLDLKEIAGGDRENIQAYLISQVNYRTLLKNGDVQSYQTYYEKYY